MPGEFSVFICYSGYIGKTGKTSIDLLSDPEKFFYFAKKRYFGQFRAC